eukprot:gene25926-31736_t
MINEPWRLNCNLCRDIWFEDDRDCASISTHTQMVSRDGARLELPEGAVLDIPRGALCEATRIRITLLAPENDAAGLSNVAVPCGPVVRLEPHNLSFARCDCSDAAYALCFLRHSDRMYQEARTLA